MDLSIIIVNFNVFNHLLKCISSIVNTLVGNLCYEIIVVDNNSSEGSIDELTVEFPQVKLIKMNRNAGFGAANNEAFKIAKGKFFLIINPDIVVKDNCVLSLYEYLEKNSKAGVAAPALFLPGGSIDYYYSFLPSVYSILMQQFGLYNSAAKMKLRMRDYMTEKINERKPFKVEQVMGACFMTRREIYEKLGGFDDIYFLYQEETDWELRMANAGWEIFIIPGAEAIHDHHSSANKLGKIYVGFQGIRSILIYYTKNFGFWKRNFLRSTMFVALLFRALKYFVTYITDFNKLVLSLKYTLKLFILSLKPRNMLLKSKYTFNG
jgi:O-antigen biosynthesis protein